VRDRHRLILPPRSTRRTIGQAQRLALLLVAACEEDPSRFRETSA
jgi:hypothetical protein